MRFSIGRGFFGAALALGALSLAPPAVAQQTAAVQGMITDIASGAPIADARVTIVGTVLQSTTNVLGNYRITGIPAGNVSVQVRRIGYKALTAAVTLAEGHEFSRGFAVGVWRRSPGATRRCGRRRGCGLPRRAHQRSSPAVNRMIA